MAVDVLVMAAGLALRMGGPNKVLALLNGETLVHRAARAALDSKAREVVVVVGRDSALVTEAIRDLPVRAVFNADYATGFSSSLRSGFSKIQPSAGGVIVMLADMPLVETAHLDGMIEAFEDNGGAAIIRAADGDIPGNPVLLPAALFAFMAALGDAETGRDVIARSGLPTVLVDIRPAALADCDTPEALTRLGCVIAPGA